MPHDAQKALAVTPLSRTDQILLKEMDLVQALFNKHDDWIVRIRTGALAALTALVSVEFLASSHVAHWRLICIGGLVMSASYLTEGLIRAEHWVWYVNRKKEIEAYWNGERPSGIRLYVMKAPSAVSETGDERRERRRRCWRKRDTLLFHICGWALFAIVVLLVKVRH